MSPSKNVLLINPWIYDFTAYDFWMKPLGLLYVASLIRRFTPHSVSFIDCLDRAHPGLKKAPAMHADGRGPFPKEEVPKPAVLRGVPRRFSRYGIPVSVFEEELARSPKPDAVLLTSAMTYWYPGVQAVVDLVRRRFGAVPVVLGGVYATLCPGHARAETGADLIVPGPAEESLFAALAAALGASSSPFPDLSGPDALPPPAFDLLRDRTWLPVMTSRGCPLRCSFCASSLLSPVFSQRPVAAVLSEILESHARFGTRHFAFYDDALLSGKKGHALPLFEGLAGAALPLSFHTPNGLHLREIDGTTARLLRAAGVRSLYLSLESTDEALMRERSPKASAEDLARALGELERAGYERRAIGVYLIMGLPGQGVAGIAESVRFVRDLRATPRVAFFSPIPGTAEWTTLVHRGILSEDSDPLLQNKTAFAYLKSDIPMAESAAFKRMIA
ncbi:MAG: radical SAM protein [Candidatus Aminicenantes bacterium]|nr:radical SAM protein [Candidatus Aminicenantes bacterium]